MSVLAACFAFLAILMPVMHWSFYGVNPEQRFMLSADTLRYQRVSKRISGRALIAARALTGAIVVFIFVMFFVEPQAIGAGALAMLPLAIRMFSNDAFKVPAQSTDLTKATRIERFSPIHALRLSGKKMNVAAYIYCDGAAHETKVLEYLRATHPGIEIKIVN